MTARTITLDELNALAESGQVCGDFLKFISEKQPGVTVWDLYALAEMLRANGYPQMAIWGLLRLFDAEQRVAFFIWVTTNTLELMPDGYQQKAQRQAQLYTVGQYYETPTPAGKIALQAMLDDFEIVPGSYQDLLFGHTIQLLLEVIIEGAPATQDCAEMYGFYVLVVRDVNQIDDLTANNEILTKCEVIIGIRDEVQAIRARLTHHMDTHRAHKKRTFKRRAYTVSGLLAAAAAAAAAYFW